ncbi:hypothetical protein CAOG_009363 [Capsaspora owczarzaki ATCC 30864]|uniref:HRDC domain-containing protein n=1 Tax=Capsaspora owczarzaki (strain ATCC 30864) TaxID=595528 RepID=A0A0D2VHM2_CAPO3|nr:hypothetical protein CAOG_009363 [Capsaspora owczarzaki ATCC 30864]
MLAAAGVTAWTSAPSITASAPAPAPQHDSQSQAQPQPQAGKPRRRKVVDDEPPKPVRKEPPPPPPPRFAGRSSSSTSTSASHHSGAPTHYQHGTSFPNKRAAVPFFQKAPSSSSRLDSSTRPESFDKSAVVEDPINRPIHYISTDAEVEAFLPILAAAETIGLDTEFLSFPRYTPQLCVLQLSTETDLGIVDALSISPEMLKKLCLRICEKPVIVHSCSSDCAILYDIAGTLPAKVFDTQIAAAFCYPIMMMGYGQLVETLFEVQVDKSLTLTDWSLRPLKKDEVAYAISDVVHLHAIRDKLNARIAELGRTEWFESEMASAVSPAKLMSAIPWDAWKLIRRIGKLRDTASLSVVRELAAWRETYAKEQNMAPIRIIRDEILIAIASAQPTTFEQLNRMQSSKNFSRHNEALLRVVQAGISVPEEQRPPMPPPPNPIADILQQQLRLWARIKSAQMSIAPDLLLTNQLATQLSEAPPADFDKICIESLQGWREELVCHDLIAMHHGHLSLRYNPVTDQVETAMQENIQAPPQAA